MKCRSCQNSLQAMKAAYTADFDALERPVERRSAIGSEQNRILPTSAFLVSRRGHSGPAASWSTMLARRCSRNVSSNFAALRPS